EGARRADEGARAQRSVPLMLPGRARAARFARALIRRFAPPSPAAQEKGSFRTVRQGADGGSPSPAAQEKGWSRTSRRETGRKPFSRLREKVPGGRMRGRERSEACFCCCLEEQEQLASLAPSSGASRHLLPLRRRRAFSG